MLHIAAAVAKAQSTNHTAFGSRLGAMLLVAVLVSQSHVVSYHGNGGCAGLGSCFVSLHGNGGCVGLGSCVVSHHGNGGCVSLGRHVESHCGFGGCAGLGCSVDSQCRNGGCVGLGSSVDSQCRNGGCVGLGSHVVSQCGVASLSHVNVSSGFINTCDENVLLSIFTNVVKSLVCVQMTPHTMPWVTGVPLGLRGSVCPGLPIVASCQKWITGRPGHSLNKSTMCWFFWFFGFLT